MKNFFTKSGLFLCLFFLSSQVFSQTYSSAVNGTIHMHGSATTARSSSGDGTLTINKPSGTFSGEVLIANIVQNDANGRNLSNVTIPTGWTLIDGREIYDAGTSQFWGTILYRITDGSEPSSYSFTLDLDAEMSIGSIVSFAGVDVTSGPFDVAPGTLNLTNSATATASAISNLSSNAAIIMFSQVANDLNYSNWTATSPSSFVELYDDTTQLEGHASVGASWVMKSSIGSTGSASVTLTGSNRNAAILIALKPILKSPYRYYNGAYGATQDISNTSAVSLLNKTIPLSASYFTSTVQKVSIIFDGSFDVEKVYVDKDGDGILNTSGGTDFALVYNTDFFFDNQSHNVHKLTINLPAITSGGSLYNIFIQSRATNLMYADLFIFAASALPVTLKSFTAKPTSTSTVALNWATSSEIVNKGFRIERQAGGVNGKFESIGFVASKAFGGNSQTALYYNFIDASPKSGSTAYYRLAQEDLDGKTNFSEVKIVKLNGETVTMVFPTLSNGAVNISRTANGKRMNIQVIDMAGRMVQQFTNITDSNYKLNISKSGIYNIKMTYPETGEQSVQKIVIEK
jgi:hypothetical protein